MSKVSKDRRARDILDEIEARQPPGQRLMDRVGRRGWGRPNVATSARLYKKYQLPDPWDPAAKNDVKPIGLGPVSLRLGEQRRQPAPHLKPREPKKKKKSKPGFPSPQRSASRSSSSRSSSSGSGGNLPAGFTPPRGVSTASLNRKPAPKPPRRDTELSREFGGRQKRKLVGKLPVRPDLALSPDGTPTGKAPAAQTKAKGSRAQPAPVKPPTPSRRRPTPRITPTRMTSTRPPIVEPPVAAAPGGEDGTVNRRPPMPQRSSAKRTSGRVRMTSTPRTTAPVITPIASPTETPVVEAAPPSSPQPTAPNEPERLRGLQRAKSASMDDLFDFAAQEGRMRLGRRSEKKPDKKTE